MALSDKQERFCQEYMIDANATAAYIRAGFKARGHTAEVEASRLLRNPEIQARLQELNAERSQRLNELADRVVRQLEAIAFAKATDLLTYIVDDRETGAGHYELKPPEELSEDLQAAIAGVRISRLNVTLKLCDKTQAMALLAKILGMTSDFNTALAVLRRYGISLAFVSGRWQVVDQQMPESDDLAGENFPQRRNNHNSNTIKVTDLEGLHSNS